MTLTIMAIALVLLTAAVVALFAMMGELRGLLDAHSEEIDSEVDWSEPLDSWKPPELQNQYPSDLSVLAHAQTGALLVLSTSCRTCEALARKGVDPLKALTVPTGIVISTPRRERAQAFLDSYPTLRSIPHYIDVGGDWSRENLNVDMSPSVVALSNGKPQRVWAVSTATALVDLVESELYPT